MGTVPLRLRVYCRKNNKNEGFINKHVDHCGKSKAHERFGPFKKSSIPVLFLPPHQNFQEKVQVGDKMSVEGFLGLHLLERLSIVTTPRASRFNTKHTLRPLIA